MTTVVHFGNSSARESYKVDPEGKTDEVDYRNAPGERITEMVLPDGLPLDEMTNTVLTAMERHLIPGRGPDFVQVTGNPLLQQWLVEHYKLGKNKIPKSYGEDTGAREVLLHPMTALTGLQAFLGVQTAVMGALALYAASKLQLRTNSGRDFQHGVMFSTSSTGTGAFAPANWIGLSADTTPPAATDVVLTGEVIAGTLVRAPSTYTHTTGTASSTLTKLFTSDQTIIVAKIGIFIAAAGGAPVLSTLLSAVGNMVSGDQLSVTETITL